jgi:hypothetical protein
MKQIRRDSKEYGDKKMSWMLVQSPIWHEFLKPLLEQKALSREIPQLNCLEDSYKVAKEQAKSDYAKYLMHRIEQYAGEFPNLKVDPES